MTKLFFYCDADLQTLLGAFSHESSYAIDGRLDFLAKQGAVSVKDPTNMVWGTTLTYGNWLTQLFQIIRRTKKS